MSSVRACSLSIRREARPEHTPIGDPCTLCRQMAKAHRVEHKFQGRNRKRCARCGLPLENHRLDRKTDTRVRVRKYERRAYEPLILGIDGEGQSRDRHRYVFLAACDESRTRKFFVENDQGLSTHECLKFLYQLPQRARLFAYSFGYDLTKILQSMTETQEGRRALWFLMRPEKRQRFGKEAAKGPYAVIWEGWSLNLQGTKFTFGRTGKSGHRRVLWDIFKFYQSKFVTALEDWKIGTPEERKLILDMKEKRAFFDQLPKEKVQEYCFLECSKMAEQARRLISAHEEAGLPLTTFYGAGSTASVMLKKMGVKEHISETPAEMRLPVAMAFSGGRFEIGHIGAIRNAVHSYDISSAYPYQLCHLPCLVHGHWEHVKSRKSLSSARWALVRYSLDRLSDVRHPVYGTQLPWGPFPFRFPKGHAEEGSICYPSESGGGWVYLAEYLQGERLFPNVRFEEAWIYRSECEDMPFQKIPIYYQERCKLGKEGAGIPLKLGPNSCYGKVAQSVGKGQFNCWIWAGMITSGCRAQGLEMLGLHGDWHNLLMFATDGLLTRETLTPPIPTETGTFHVSECKEHKKMCTVCPPESQTKKPLGGWEYKAMDRGVFIARPGVYFPMDPTEDDIRTLRARGIGRRSVLDNWERIVHAWEKRKRGQWPTLQLDNISRFCGAKTSISRVRRNGEWIYRAARGNHLKGNPRYGEWIERKVEMSFDPKPKRIGKKDGSLSVRKLDRNMMSAPYDRAVLSAEAKELIALQEMLAEQPHADFFDYDAD